MNVNKADKLSLAEFVATLKEAHDDKSEVAYYRLEAKRAIRVMLGQCTKRGMRWRETDRLRHNLTVYDKSGAEVDTKALAASLRIESADLLEGYFVKGADVARVYGHLEFPWRDSAGNLIYLATADRLDVSDFLSLLAEANGHGDVSNSSQWIAGHGLAVMDSEKCFLSLKELPGWPDSIAPGKYEVSEFDVACTYWAAGEERYPWIDPMGKVEWKSLPVKHHDGDLAGHAMLFAADPERYPVEDLEDLRDDPFARREPAFWIGVELARNRGYFVDWKHWADRKSWNAKQAACLLYSVDPGEWSDPEKPREGYKGQDLRTSLKLPQILSD